MSCPPLISEPCLRTCLLVPPSSNTAFVSLRGHRKPVLFVGFFSGWAVCIAAGLSLADSDVFLAANFHLELRGRSQAMFCTPVVGN